MKSIDQMAEDYRISRYRSLGMAPQYHHADIEVAFSVGYTQAGRDVEKLAKSCAELSQHWEEAIAANFEEQREREKAQNAADLMRAEVERVTRCCDKLAAKCEGLMSERDTIADLQKERAFLSEAVGEWKQIANDRAGWTPPHLLADLEKAAYDAGVVSGMASKREAEIGEAVTKAASDMLCFGSGAVLVNNDGVKHVPLHGVKASDYFDGGVVGHFGDSIAYRDMASMLAVGGTPFDCPDCNPRGASSAQQAKPHADTLNAMDECSEAPGPSDQVRDLQAKCDALEARANKWEARALILSDAFHDLVDTLD